MPGQRRPAPTERRRPATSLRLAPEPLAFHREVVVDALDRRHRARVLADRALPLAVGNAGAAAKHPRVLQDELSDAVGHDVVVAERAQKVAATEFRLYVLAPQARHR